MPIDFKTFDSIINNTIDPDAENYSVMIRGRHGIGKSQVVYQYAEKMKWTVAHTKFVSLSLSLGIPANSTGGVCTPELLFSLR